MYPRHWVHKRVPLTPLASHHHRSIFLHYIGKSGITETYTQHQPPQYCRWSGTAVLCIRHKRRCRYSSLFHHVPTTLVSPRKTHFKNNPLHSSTHSSLLTFYYQHHRSCCYVSQPLIFPDFSTSTFSTTASVSRFNVPFPFSLTLLPHSEMKFFFLSRSPFL